MMRKTRGKLWTKMWMRMTKPTTSEAEGLGLRWNRKGIPRRMTDILTMRRSIDMCITYYFYYIFAKRLYIYFI